MNQVTAISKTPRHLLMAGIFLASLTGCVSGPPQILSNIEANRAFEKGEYSKARAEYEKALNQAEQNNDRQYSAIAMYGISRASTQLCDFSAAEIWLLRSIQVRESIPDSAGAYITQNRMELARHYFRQKRYVDANAQYALAIQGLDKLKIEQSDPIAYANELEDYAKSLSWSGRNTDADKVSIRAARLKAENPNKLPYFRRDPEPNCPVK